MQKTRLRCKVTKPAALSGEKRTVIIGKRKIIAIPQEEIRILLRTGTREGDTHTGETRAAYPAESSSLSDDDGMSVEIRDRVFQARDEIFEGKGIRKPIPATGTGFHAPPYRTQTKEESI